MSYAAYEHWKTTPIQGEPYLSVVIPAYNEAERIVPTIGAIAAYVSGARADWELIISDDGSQDNTADLCRSLELANLRVLQADRNGGKGSAVRRGMLAARGRYVLFSDADNSTPIEELARLLAALESGQYDVAVGSRAVAGAEEAKRSLLRRVLSGGLRAIVRYGLRVGVQDTQCGFKLFTRQAAQRLHKAQTLMGFSFDLEILFLAARFGYRVAEVPVAWVDAPGSKVDPVKEARRFLKDLWQIKLNDLRGHYPTV
jgi:dolichyl-phosphate beta-glucosyltransferase